MRALPTERGYLIAAGLEQALAYIRDLRFRPKALAYLEKNAGGDAAVTAIHFLKTNKVWKSWVPADVAKKVEEALKSA